MHDENSFMETFGIGQTAVISIKIHKSLLIHRKIVIFFSGCRISYASMLVFNFESISNIIMPENFRHRGSA
jgi:hypothetical protein